MLSLKNRAISKLLFQSRSPLSFKLFVVGAQEVPIDLNMSAQKMLSFLSSAGKFALGKSDALY